MIQTIITFFIGEIQDELPHVEVNGKPTEPMPKFNEWSKTIFNNKNQNK